MRIVMRHSKTLLTALIVTAIMPAQARAQESEFDRGYKAGYAQALADNTKPVVPGTVIIPGSQFSTILEPGASGTNFELSNESTIAIIPDSSLKDMTEKLGADYLKDNNIILNNRLEVE